MGYNKDMNIFTQIKNSIYNKDYYKNVVLIETPKESVKYLARLCLVVALVACIILAFIIPPVFKIVKIGVSSFATSYPNDLTLSIKNGEATINQPEPYIVKTPGYLTNINKSKKPLPENVVVMDTTEPFDLMKFKEHKTISLITKTEIAIVQPDTEEMRIIPLYKFGNIEIDKNWVLNKEKIIVELLPWIMFSLIPLIYVGIFLGIFVGMLITLFFYALIVWLIFKIKKTDMSYHKSYQIALHASTLIILLSIITAPLGFMNFFIKVLLLGIVVFINFNEHPTLTKPTADPLPDYHNAE